MTSAVHLCTNRGIFVAVHVFLHRTQNSAIIMPDNSTALTHQAAPTHRRMFSRLLHTPDNFESAAAVSTERHVANDPEDGYGDVNFDASLPNNDTNDAGEISQLYLRRAVDSGMCQVGSITVDFNRLSRARCRLVCAFRKVKSI